MTDQNKPVLPSTPIPEQVLQAGSTISLDISSHFSPPHDEILVYHAEGLPPGMVIDPNTGVISGTAMDVPLATPFLVSVTATSQQTQQQATEYFPIVIIDTAQALPEGQHDVLPQSMDQKNNLTEEQRWQLQEWITYIIQEHYATAYFFDGGYPPKPLGAFQGIQTASTGFSIYVFENCFIVSPGKMAFAEDGNRGRMLRTMEEVCEKYIPAKQWEWLAIAGSDERTTDAAWVLGKIHNLPVFEPGPSNKALIEYRNLVKLRGVSPHVDITKQPL